MWLVVYVGLLLHLIAGRVEGNVRCYECIDMPHPSDCEFATTCTSSERCYVEQVVSSGGLVLYNSGCKAITRCDVSGSGKRDVTAHLRRRRDDIIVCQECCDGQFCNDNGCSMSAVRFPQRGLKCFNCKDLINLSECRDLTICQDPSEVCMVHDFIGPDNRPRYETKCAGALFCKAFSTIHGKRSSSNYNCVRCCNSDFCNIACNDSSTGSTGGAATGSNVITMRMTATPTTIPSTTPPPTTQPPPPTTQVTTLTPQDFCQRDSYLYIGFIPFCFKFHKELKTRDEAQKVCHSEQGQLAVIDSERKWDFAGKVYSQQLFSGIREFYIDGKYDNGQNNFVCHGNQVCTFSHWGTNMPKAAATKPCVFLNGSDSMRWYNGVCSDRKMFICTKQI